MTGPGDQLAFDLPHRPALGRADFLVAPANELAVAWIDRWPAWPQTALVLTGPAGSGKTHLAQVWRQAAGAVAVTPAALAEAEPAALLGDARTAFLDEAGAALAAAQGPAAVGRGLLHLYNVLGELGGHLLLADRQPPGTWPVALPDLASRLGAAPVAALGPPDDALIAALLVKLFADRQLSVAPEVLAFLLPRMERSFAAAQRLVAALDRAALARQSGITVPLARAVLSAAPESVPEEAEKEATRWTLD